MSVDFLAGNTGRVFATFLPESGTVAVENVSAWLIAATGTTPLEPVVDDGTVYRAGRDTPAGWEMLTPVQAATAGVAASVTPDEYAELAPAVQAQYRLGFVFHVDWAIPDNAVEGARVVRFESNAPAPKMSIEGDDTTIYVFASKAANP